jgi:hypothetical protein
MHHPSQNMWIPHVERWRIHKIIIGASHGHNTGNILKLVLIKVVRPKYALLIIIAARDSNNNHLKYSLTPFNT